MAKVRSTACVFGICGLIIGAFASGACRSDLLHPAEGPGTSYPCGIRGVECSNGTCCPYQHECSEPGKGFFNTCPVGYCCYIGPDTYGASRADASTTDGGAVKAWAKDAGPPRQ